MTIAKRLIILLTVPLAALVGLGIFTRLQLAQIEAHSRFVAESRFVALATLGNLSRSFAELRVNLRSHLLATTDAQRAAARGLFDDDEQDVNRLIREYADGLVLGDKDRRLLDEYQNLSREWIAGAKQIMSLSNEGRGEEARALFNGSFAALGPRLSEVSNEWIAFDQEAATAAGQDSIAGIERFVRRVWRLIREPHVVGKGGVDLRTVDRTIASVGADLDAMRFNTAIASLMELVRWARREKSAMSSPEWSRVSSCLVLLLAPFAPYLTEEMWSRLGGEYSVHQQSWPAHDPSALISDRVTVAIQIDGKTRDRIEVLAGTERDDVIEQALKRAGVRRHLGQGRPTNVVFVQDRLINFVTRSSGRRRPDQGRSSEMSGG